MRSRPTRPRSSPGPSRCASTSTRRRPVVLDAIKAELNQDSRPGRFVLTGSTRHDSLPAAVQALTGRLSRLTVYPLAQVELEGNGSSILEQLFDDPAATVAAVPTSTTTREEYVERVVAGGFPMALARSTANARARWFDDYVNLTLERDVQAISRIRQGDLLPKLLHRLTGQTAQVLNVNGAGRDVGLDHTTAEDYTRLLEKVFLIERLPSWGKTLIARTGAKPKLHVVDSGVAARLLRLTPEKLLRLDTTALTELGHLLETFVVGELVRQASWPPPGPPTATSSRSASSPARSARRSWQASSSTPASARTTSRTTCSSCPSTASGWADPGQSQPGTALLNREPPGSMANRCGPSSSRAGGTVPTASCVPRGARRRSTTQS